MALTVALNLLLSNAAGSIWGIIESLQVASHSALFDMKTPGNVNGFNLFFVELSSFEVIDFAKISQSITYLPECDPFTLNFAMP